MMFTFSSFGRSRIRRISCSIAKWGHIFSPTAYFPELAYFPATETISLWHRYMQHWEMTQLTLQINKDNGSSPVQMPLSRAVGEKWTIKRNRPCMPTQWHRVLTLLVRWVPGYVHPGWLARRLGQVGRQVGRYINRYVNGKVNVHETIWVRRRNIVGHANLILVNNLGESYIL